MYLVSELSAPYWAGVAAIATLFGLLATVAIAIIVQRASRRTTEASNRIATSVQELARLSRRDEIYRQIQESEDQDHLALLLLEGRRITHGQERLNLERYYFANPAVSLLTYEHMLPSDVPPKWHPKIMQAVLRSLPNRYPASQTTYHLAEELAHLTHLSGELEAGRHEVASFLMDRAQEGWRFGDDTIRSIIMPKAGDACPPNLDVCSEYLYPLERRMPRTNLVNILAGVSLAVLDFECERGAVKGMHPALIGFATLIKDGALADIGETGDDAGMTISVDHCVAVMVHAVGIAALRNHHLTMRALEGLPGILDSFPAGQFARSEIVAHHLQEGVRRLVAAHDSDLLTQPLKHAAERLVPTLDGRAVTAPWDSLAQGDIQ